PPAGGRRRDRPRPGRGCAAAAGVRRADRRRRARQDRVERAGDRHAAADVRPRARAGPPGADRARPLHARSRDPRPAPCCRGRLPRPGRPRRRVRTGRAGRGSPPRGLLVVRLPPDEAGHAGGQRGTHPGGQRGRPGALHGRVLRLTRALRLPASGVPFTRTDSGARTRYTARPPAGGRRTPPTVATSSRPSASIVNSVSAPSSSASGTRAKSSAPSTTNRPPRASAASIVAWVTPSPNGRRLSTSTSPVSSSPWRGRWYTLDRPTVPIARTSP